MYATSLRPGPAIESETPPPLPPPPQPLPRPSPPSSPLPPPPLPPVVAGGVHEEPSPPDDELSDPVTGGGMITLVDPSPSPVCRLRRCRRVAAGVTDAEGFWGVVVRCGRSPASARSRAAARASATSAWCTWCASIR